MKSKKVLVGEIQNYFDAPLIGLEKLGAKDLSTMLNHLQDGLSVAETFRVPKSRKRLPFEEQLCSIFPGTSFSKANVPLMHTILKEIEYTR